MLCLVIILLIAGGLYAASISNVGFLGAQTQRGNSFPSIPSNPLYWFDFENNIQDSTPNTNHLNGSNGVLTFVAGKVNNALQFATVLTNYVYREFEPNTITRNFTNQPTWSGWFTLNSIPFGTTNYTIFCISAYTAEYEVQLNVFSNKLEFAWNDSMGGSDTVATNISSAGGLPGGVWQTNTPYFFSLRYGGGGAYLQLNNGGEIFKSHGQNIRSVGSPDVLYIGILYDAGAVVPSTCFNGWIDSLNCFTNPLLSAGAVITNLYNNGNGNYYH